MKAEFKFGHEKSIPDLIKMQHKTREFFIPSVNMVFLSSVVQKERMYFERGNVIRIGMKFWHGGAYDLARYLNYNIPRMFFGDGDIEALDKKVKDWELYLYIASSCRYFNWKKMNRSQRRMLERLIRKLMYFISSKVVLHAGTFWRFMTGVMYSGGLETSHGDSWIMALIFFLYLNHVISQHPSLASVITEQIVYRYIAIAVFGDDHLWCCPDFLRPVINVLGFRDFLSRYCDMNLRDYREYDSFLSVPDRTTGLLKVVGPKFLKRYFIANDIDPRLAPVLPYKPLFEPMLKNFVDSEHIYENYILKSIGMAWDTMGTNPIHYRLVQEFFERLMFGNPRTPDEMYRHAVLGIDGRLKMNKMIRRVGIPADKFFAGFPSLEEMQERHVIDKEKAAYGNKGDWMYSMSLDLGIMTYDEVFRG